MQRSRLAAPVIVVLALGIACASAVAAPAAVGLSQSPATQPDLRPEKVWVVKEQDRNDWFSFNWHTGEILDCKYHHKQHPLRVTVVKVDLPGKPGMVENEIDSVYFALQSGEEIPGHPKLRVIHYMFNADDVGWHWFSAGQPWEVTLTDEGGLLDLRPLTPRCVYFDSLFDEWAAQGSVVATRPADAPPARVPTTLPAVAQKTVWVVSDDDAIKNLDFDKRDEVLGCRYHGKQHVLQVTVAKLDLPWKSASVAGDIDSVYFALRPEDTIPGHPDLRTIRYKFDGDGLGWHTFQLGQVWQITLKDDGGLLDLAYPKGHGIWDGSMFQREMWKAEMHRIGLERYRKQQ